MSGTSWGVAIAMDPKGRNASKWKSIRNKALRSSSQSKGLTGQALDDAVMALAMADPSLVKFEHVGDT